MNKRVNLFAALFLAFVLVLIFPMFIHTTLYHNMRSIIKEDAIRSNEAVLNQINQIIDSRLREIDQMADQISFHPKVQQMMYRHSAHGELAYWQYADIMDLMVQPKNKNELLHDYFIYFRQQEAVITPYVKTDPDTFFHNYYTYTDLDIARWRQILTPSSTDAIYLPAMEIRKKSSPETDRFITYIKPLPNGQAGDISQGSLVILISENRLRAMLQHLVAPSQGEYILMDRNGNVLTTSSDKLRSYLTNFGHLQAEVVSGASSIVLGDETMLLTQIESAESGWRYYSLVSESVFMEKVNRVQVWALSLLVVCLLFGLFGAFMLARMFYRPVDRLVRSILQTKNMDMKVVSGEYKLIEDTILSSWNSENQLKAVLNRQTPVIQANLLNRLFKGLVEQDSLKTDVLDFMGIRFESNWFVVVLINVNTCSSFNKMDPERKWALARGIVANICQESVERHHYAYVLEMDRSQLALLINLKTEPEQGVTVMKHALEYAKLFMDSKFGIDVGMGVSEVHSGIADISVCYGEALQALEYRIVTGNSTINSFSEIRHDSPQYFYPVEVEQQLIKVIKIGDFSSADQLLDHVYDMNFRSRHISLEIGKCLYFNMLSTLLKIWNELSATIEMKSLGGDFNPILRVSDSSTLAEMHKEIKDVYKSICEAIASARKDPGAIVSDRIAAFIHESYADYSLSLNLLAEHFQLTPQYLSQFFKKWTGQNIAEYIAKVRIEQAKRLLENDSLTLNQIAEAVGYSNDAGLIRVFKKVERITPGKYRELLHEKLEGMR